MNELDEELYNKSRASNIKIKKIQKKVDAQKAIVDIRKQELLNKIIDVDLVIGIDNGVTGTIGALSKDQSYYFYCETPIKTELDYTKEIQKINRIDFFKLKETVESIIYTRSNINKPLVVLERPMVNTQRFKSSCIALRAYEATLIVLEQLKLNYITIDSKQWQHYLFGKNTTLLDLKKESCNLGITLYPLFKKEMSVHGDADSILICKYIIEKVLK